MQKSDTCKVQITILIDFISAKDTDEEQTMHPKNDNIEVMTYDNLDEIIEELFESLLSRWKIGSETRMRDNDFIFDCVNLLYYKCHKINFKRGISNVLIFQIG